MCIRDSLAPVRLYVRASSHRARRGRGRLLHPSRGPDGRRARGPAPGVGSDKVAQTRAVRRDRSPPRSLGRRSAAARPICRGREHASARCDGRSSSSGEGSTPLARRRPEKVRHRTPAPRTSGGEGERGEDKVREFSFYGKTEDLFFQPTRARARGTGSLHLAHNIQWKAPHTFGACHRGTCSK